MDIKTAAERLGALGNVTRLEIFRLLVRSGPEGVPVGEIQRRTGVARSTLSHHLRQLVAVGLVQQRRQRTTLFCSTSYDAMNDTLTFLVAECCVEAAHVARESA